jgi:hypothetical protein
MDAFGVKFRIEREDLFPSLVTVFEALKQAKTNDDFGEQDDWASRLHAEARSRFIWPAQAELDERAVIRATHPVRITEPSEAVGQQWPFDSFLAAIEDGEYNLLEIARTASNTAELRIDPEAYPYGGLGAFIVLVEAHGMHVLGANEYGKYEPVSASSPSAEAESGVPKKPWWKFWR